MRIHTKLDWSEMHDVARASGAPISFQTLEAFGSRTHARAFEVRLEGTGGRSNTGYYGAGDYDGATWDEWGAFFGALYDADPDARCGGSAKNPAYANADDYHFQTADRFHGRLVSESAEPSSRDYLRKTYLPADTHPRHRWTFDEARGNDTEHYCAKDGCSARRPSFGSVIAHRRELGIGA